MATEEYTQYAFNHPFYPGESCEDIYNMNPESQDKSEYYWIINNLTKVYCGMNYRILLGYYQDISILSGCYRINKTQWNYRHDSIIFLFYW